ncbi:hypothetical protein M9Y10_034893 [Tritrichomonas musculus]|uniref:Small GTP-binding protein n=1 Tax=Tritrichomonas musculus TaxID=1915356 RepID=A0ABR2KH53_9EUKA
MQNENDTSCFRIVTIGDESVGKTSIVIRLIENRFNPHEAGTIGANYQVFSQLINGSRIELQIWDTAGQEKFRALAPIYYRSTSAAIVVFSLSNRQSFLDLNPQIETFFNVADQQAIIYVAANKSDLYDEYQVSFDECEQWAKERGFHIYLTSAKTGEGIRQMFSDLANELFKLHQKTITTNRKNQATIKEESTISNCC